MLAVPNSTVGVRNVTGVVPNLDISYFEHRHWGSERRAWGSKLGTRGSSLRARGVEPR